MGSIWPNFSDTYNFLLHSGEAVVEDNWSGGEGETLRLDYPRMLENALNVPYYMSVDHIASLFEDFVQNAVDRFYTNADNQTDGYFQLVEGANLDDVSEKLRTVIWEEINPLQQETIDNYLSWNPEEGE